MSWQKEVDEIHRRRAIARELGGPEAVAKQHAQGRLTVRERIDRLVDPGSFRELGAMTGKAVYDDQHNLVSVTPANAVIGSARIDGRRVSIDGDDWTIRGGSSEATVSDKWIYSEIYAEEMKIPLIRLVESAGGSVRILDQNAATKLPAYPTWTLARMMGKIPIVGIALGPCAGLGAIKAATAHYSIMVKGTSQVFAGGPPVVERGMGIKVSKEDLGGSKIHTRESGVMGNEAATEDEAFAMARRFLSYLPSSVYELPPVIDCDDPRDRADEALIEIIPRDQRKVYKSRKILEMVFDKGSVFELTKGYGRSVVTCFARLGGRPVGVITTDPMQYGGGMTKASAAKMEGFIDLCDTFHLPIVHLVDQPGTIVGPEAEKSGAVKGSVRVCMAIEQSQVPWCAIITRRCYGLAGSTFGRVQGLNLHYAWPSGRWGSIPVVGGAEAAFKKELDQLDPVARKARLDAIESHFHHLESPFLTAEKFRIPDIIDPRETRAILNDWLDDAWRLLPEQLGVKGRTFRM
ncbi:MAG: propionyl-CoA carboxylase [Rhodobacter sp.]|uniref:acyl-CoA carboxylase subunit beta n=1 Tax=Pararhodobacter sp. TaxID=2127056 RepID=UPI001D7A1DF1|nr:carboxyl transferase domain-containing protein [Pararhodobacter sp.]MCB1345073.1 propionyl-CoA carboxylase [Paracoccaceae bacterium]MCC0072690.1 propionyl-CoA carboxylase [Rhodobacter sp.]HPD92436.1 carboxyl transferase domain-containing protein [Pararhodobacter sp.]